MVEAKRWNRCRACGSGELVEVLDLGLQYVSDFPKPGDERKGPQVPITLQLCRSCTLVQSEWTAPQDFLYTKHYWYRSGTTATMRAALADVVASARALVDLQPFDVVLDIGANDGTLLGCYEGPVFRIGVEPARNMEVNHADRAVREFWGVDGSPAVREVLRYGMPKIVTACGMMYDLEDPGRFLADVHKILHPNGVFVAQLMCLKQTLENRDVGNFAHEHLEFYTLKSLIQLYRANGLEIFDVTENAVNGGSYRIFARQQYAPRPLPEGSTERMLGAIKAEEHLTRMENWTWFADRLAETREDVRIYLHQYRGTCHGKKWVYGASTKGNVILQWLGLDYHTFEAAVDLSPEKIGRVMVGSGVPIKSEEEFRKACPDLVLVLPYSFREEFIEREKDQEWRKRGGKFLFPLPKVEIV